MKKLRVFDDNWSYGDEKIYDEDVEVVQSSELKASLQSFDRPYLLHCNWGWGNSQDGYYVSSAFNAAKGPEFSDTSVKNLALKNSRTSDYFEHNLQFSIISSN